MTALEKDISAILHQGGDPIAYRESLAALRRVSLADVDAAIAAVGGSPRQVHPEDLAQERIAEDRRMERGDSLAYRESQHEED